MSAPEPCSAYHVGRLAAYAAANAETQAEEIAAPSGATDGGLPLAPRLAYILARQITDGAGPDDDPDLTPEQHRASAARYQLQCVSESRRPIRDSIVSVGALWHATTCYADLASTLPEWDRSAASQLTMLLYAVLGNAMADLTGGRGVWHLDAPARNAAPADVVPISQARQPRHGPHSAASPSPSGL